MSEWEYSHGPAATVDDLFAVSDLPTVTISVPRWGTGGQPLRLQVRGPSLPQQVQIAAKSRTKDRLTGDVTRDRIQFAAQTLHACVVSPRLDEAQALTLARSKNPVIIDAIVSFCWTELLHVSLDDLERIVSALSGMSLDEDPDAGDDDGDLAGA